MNSGRHGLREMGTDLTTGFLPLLKGRRDILSQDWERLIQDTHGFPGQARNACPCGSRGRAGVTGIV